MIQWEPITMAALLKGQTGRIERVEGPARVTRRLAEMGVTPGATVEMLRPGQPCILRVHHTRLSMGGRLQAHVSVSRIGGADNSPSTTPGG